MLELLLGQIPEAIFLALFMIYAKGLKEKRLLFIFLMIIEYLLTKYAFQFNWMFQITYMICVYLTLKILYKEKSQVTDIFILGIAYIIVIISSILFSIPMFVGLIKNYAICVLLNRIFLILFILFFKNKLLIIQNIYKKFWNRNDKLPKIIKSTTFRALNVVIFNILFVVFNLGMLYALYYNNFMKGGV